MNAFYVLSIDKLWMLLMEDILFFWMSDRVKSRQPGIWSAAISSAQDLPLLSVRQELNAERRQS